MNPETIGGFLLAGLILLAVFLAFRRFWVFIVRPKSIQGSDLHMLKYCVAENTRAWGGLHFTFPDDADFDAITAQVRANINQHFATPDSTFRLGVDLKSKQYYVKETLQPDDIIDVVHDDPAFFATKDDQFRELVFRIYPEKRLIGLMFDHTVWDGLRLVNEIIVPLIDSRPFASRWLLNDRYIPVLAELLQIYTILAMGTRWLLHKPMKTFPDESDQKIISHRFPLDIVKSARNRNKVKFTSALLGVWMFRLFRSLPPERKMVRVGVIIGMINPRFRNNYTIITVDVHRTDDEDAMVKAIEKQFRIRQFEVLPLYHMISCVEAQTLFKKRAIDYLFSPGFFHSNDGVSKLVQDMCFYTIPVGMPFYSFACSIDDVVTISTTLNAPEVDLKVFNEGATRQFSLADKRWLSRDF
ncbi:MAG: hypothetical protein KDI36_00025 [Pseudomonadales bacterium]|nr:hypothetical protein [Pseudomonadales bacterium]